MEHCAIDLGGRESQVCVRDATGTVLEERRVPTCSLARYLAQRPPSRVVVETCAEAFAVADAALGIGHEVRVVPATLARSLGVGARRMKNDQRDARALSEVSTRIDLPSVHIPSAQSRERKSLCGMREALIEARTKLINTVRGWLRTRSERIPSGAAETFPVRVWKHWAQRKESLPGYVERQLRAIQGLNEQVVEADQELHEIARTDATCRTLMTTPGIGPVTAVRYTAALDEVSRFADAHHVESYIGVTPGDNSSSERLRRTSITKAGSTKLRWTLVQAAWTLRRCRPGDPMVRWSREVEKRRGKQVAVVALTRKLAGVLFAMWRDGTPYDPERGADTSLLP